MLALCRLQVAMASPCQTQQVSAASVSEHHLGEMLNSTYSDLQMAWISIDALAGACLWQNLEGGLARNSCTLLAHIRSLSHLTVEVVREAA